jgi:hypothetical protein
VADAKEFAARTGCDCLFTTVFDAGRCGELHYVREDCHVVRIEFFDDSGTLVSARRWSDTTEFSCGHPAYRGSLSIEYGPVPDCKLEPQEDYCGFGGTGGNGGHDLGSFETQP